MESAKLSVTPCNFFMTPFFYLPDPLCQKTGAPLCEKYCVRPWRYPARKNPIFTGFCMVNKMVSNLKLRADKIRNFYPPF